MPKFAPKLQRMTKAIDMSDDERLIDLETRLTHLDDTVELLNDIVTEQQNTISRLEKLILKLIQEHTEMKEQFAPEITNAPPPHY